LRRIRQGQDQKRTELPPIKGFIETSFLDWEGLISSVVFLPGCNFKCPYCHNYTLVSNPHSYQTLAFEHLKERLGFFKGWIDGVVVTGGEPTLHQGLPLLLAAIKELGFKVKLDSNGHRPWVLKDLINQDLIDMVAMDVKAPLEPLAYRRAAGRTVELDRIQTSIEFLKTSDIDHQFRSTIWPAWHGEDELKDMGQALRGCRAWTLQALKLDSAWNKKAMGDGRPYTADEIDFLQKSLADPVCKL
jgi:pyruvate formate lyase activating enzyme